MKMIVISSLIQTKSCQPCNVVSLIGNIDSYRALFLSFDSFEHVIFKMIDLLVKSTLYLPILIFVACYVLHDITSKILCYFLSCWYFNILRKSAWGGLDNWSILFLEGNFIIYWILCSCSHKNLCCNKVFISHICLGSQSLS